MFHRRTQERGLAGTRAPLRASHSISALGLLIYLHLTCCCILLCLRVPGVQRSPHRATPGCFLGHFSSQSSHEAKRKARTPQQHKLGEVILECSSLLPGSDIATMFPQDVITLGEHEARLCWVGFLSNPSDAGWVLSCSPN